MEFTIKTLTKEYEGSYTKFILNKKESLMYYSLAFRSFLTDLLEDESEYLIAVNNNSEVIGCLPIFYRDDLEFGIVANSLPYYGGHGGVLADSDDVRLALLYKYMDVIKYKGCIASTIIGSPLENFDQLYKNVIKQDFIDERIELMTYFPYIEDVSNAEALMGIYHHMERRCIKKAIKNNVVVEVDNSEDAFNFLYNIHTENMVSIGGLPKIKKCFDLIPKHFKASVDYDIFIAKKDEEKIAALLVFYFNRTVEYYTPAIVERFRTIQPLAYIIYVAMQKAMENGFEKWNWGGTGLSQKSLYNFKSKWGTTETRYFYYTRIWNNTVFKIDREVLMKAYSNYYVYPFNQVEVTG